MAITTERTVTRSLLTSRSTYCPCARTFQGLDSDRLVGDCHLGPEFLRLAVRPAHQSHAGDAGRKAQVVLDARRGASLAAERATVEHHRRQTFGRGVDRSGKPCRTGTDDGYVVDLGGIDRAHQPDAAGEIGLGGIAKQLAAGTEDDGKLTGSDMEALDQRLGLGIDGRIEPLMRVPVAGEEPHYAE